MEFYLKKRAIQHIVVSPNNTTTYALPRPSAIDQRATEVTPKGNRMLLLDLATNKPHHSPPSTGPPHPCPLP